jgi:HK97 gp10 family phage protein
MARSEVDDSAIRRALRYNTDVTAALNKVGKRIAEDAAAAAPKQTGAGARSIHHEIGYDTDGAYVRVSWTKERFYMAFAELGTSKQNATPFLRPAATRPRNI